MSLTELPTEVLAKVGRYIKRKWWFLLLFTALALVCVLVWRDALMPQTLEGSSSNSLDLAFLNSVIGPLVGALIGASVGALFNYLFNKRLENDRAKQAKVLAQWQRKFERSQLAWDALDTLRLDISGLRYSVEAFSERLSLVLHERAAVIQAWTVGEPAIAAYQNAVQRGGQRLRGGYGQDDLEAIHVLADSVAQLRGVTDTFRKSLHSDDTNALGVAVVRCVNACSRAETACSNIADNLRMEEAEE